MNLGKTIQDLRKQQNITQEDLAAQLGVTAAAVSKWENSYTLPDILMLSAIADYFNVTTDELLGRSPKSMYAIIATDSQEFGLWIAEKVKQYGFIIKNTSNTLADALEMAKNDPTITHLFASFEKPLSEEEKNERPDSLFLIESQGSKREDVLDGFDIYFRNMTAINSIAQK